MSLILVAVCMGDMAEVMRLVEENPDCVNTVDTIGGSNRWSPLQAAVNNRDREMIIYLIDHGADVNQRVERGKTLLYFAATLKYEDMLELLLAKRC